MTAPSWLDHDPFNTPLLDIDLSNEPVGPYTLTSEQRALLVNNGNICWYVEFVTNKNQIAEDKTIISAVNVDGNWGTRYVGSTGHYQLTYRSSDLLAVQGAASPSSTHWRAGQTFGVEMTWAPVFDRAGVRLVDNGCIGTRDSEVISTSIHPNGTLKVNSFSSVILGSDFTSEQLIRFRAFRVSAIAKERPAEIVIIGDSTSGTPFVDFANLGTYIYRAAEASTRLGIATLAKPGNTILQQTAYWNASRYVGDGRVKAIFIMLGINDAATNRTIEQMRADMQALVDSILTTNPNAKIIIARPVPARGYLGSTQFSRLEELAESIMGIVAPITGVHARLGDFYNYIGSDGFLLEEFDPNSDGVHEGNNGRHVIANELRLSLGELGILSDVSWSTSDLSSLKLDLRADTGATPTLWDDQSIGNNNATDPGSASLRPTIGDSDFEDNYGVVFDGGDYMPIAINLPTGAKTIAFSYKLNAVPGSGNFCTILRFKNNSDKYCEVIAINGGGYQNLTFLFDFTSGPAIGIPLPLDTDPHDVIIEYSAVNGISFLDNYRIWVDGNVWTTRASGSLSVEVLAIGALGARLTSTPSSNFHMTGVLAKVLARETRTEHTDILNIHEWLRYGEESWTSQVICDGNSITFGFGATALDLSSSGPNLNNYPYQLSALLGGPTSWNVINLGVNGLRTDEMLARYDTIVGPLYNPKRPRNVYVAHEIGNSIFFGYNARQSVDQLWDLCKKAKKTGFEVMVAVPSARGYAGNVTVQNILADARNMIRLEWRDYADYLLDLMADSRLDDYTDSTYFVAGVDDVHLNSTGLGVHAQLVNDIVSGWTPKSLISGIFWHDPNDATKITTSGGIVSSHLNSNGAAGAATNATAGQQPAHSLTSLGGRGGITFDGNDWLQQNYNVNGAQTVALSFKLNSVPSAGQRMTLMRLSSGSERAEIFLANETGLSAINFVFESDTSGSTTVGFGEPGSLDTNIHTLVIGYNNGTITSPSSYRATYDGDFKILTEGTVTITHPGTFNGGWGARIDSSGYNSQGFIGVLGDVICSNTFASLADHRRLHEYMELSTWAPQVICDGNSLTVGTGLNEHQSYPAQLRNEFGVECNVIQIGVSNQKTSDMTADFWSEIAPMYSENRSRNVIICWEVGNDVAAGTNASTAAANVAAYATAARAVGFEVIVGTGIKRTTAADTGTNAVLASANALIRSQWTTYADGLADFAEEPELQDPTNIVYFQSDAINLTASGATIAKNVVRRALNELVGLNKTIYASATPTGDGSTPSTPCSLATAQTTARSWLSSNGVFSTANIKLRDTGGVFRLSSTINLNTQDSGTTYEAYNSEEPIISGGTVVTGWTIVDVLNDIWRADLPVGLTAPYPQELFIDGKRALRARGSYLPAGWTKKTIAGGDSFNGFTAPDTSISTYTYPTSGTLVGHNNWKRFRVGIESVSGANITARASDWAASQNQIGVTFDSVAWVEGYREFVQNGHGYFAVDAGGIYYKPRPGEDMTTAEAILPTLEQLISISGTLSAKNVNIIFNNIKFEHTTWKEPYQTTVQNADACGFSTLQGHIHGIHPDFRIIPAAILIRTANDIIFNECEFSKFVNVGLAFEYGSQYCIVQGCIFTDIGSTPIILGEATDAEEDSHPTDSRQKISNIVIKNNVSVDCGQVYDSCDGFIWTAYVDNCSIVNNVVELGYGNLISSGLGWGLNDSGGTGWPQTVSAWATDSVNGPNIISKNLLRGAGRTVEESGSIYLNGAQNQSIISQNWISGADYYSVYCDNGCKEANLDKNACEGTGTAISIYCQTLPIQATDNSITDTYLNESLSPADIDSGHVSNIVSGTVSGTSWTAAGRAVLAAAGLESSYSDLRAPQVARKETACVLASSYEAAGALTPDRLIDGGIGLTYWQSAASDTSPWVIVDLGQLHTVEEVIVIPRLDNNNSVWRRSFKIQGASSYSGPWTDLYEQSSTPVWAFDLVRIPNVNSNFRYIKVLKTAAEVLSLTEILVYGKPVNTTLLWEQDWSDLPAGSLGSFFISGPEIGKSGAGGGLVFEVRNSAITIRTSDTTAATVAIGNPGNAQYTNDNSKRGLSFYPGATLITAQRDPSVYSTPGTGVTYTSGYTTSPLGTDTSSRVEVVSDGFSNYNAFGTTNPSKATLSYWVKGSTAVPIGIYNSTIFDVATQSLFGTTSSSWKFVTKTFDISSTLTFIIPVEGRAGAGGVPAAGARDVVIDFISLYAGIDSGPWCISTRPGESMHHTAVNYLCSSGTLKLEAELSAIGISSSNMTSAMRLWTDRDDATTYVEIGTNRIVTVSVSGTTSTLPTAIPVWNSLSTWKLRVDAGNSQPTGTVTIDGVVTSLGTGATGHSAISTINMDLGCDGTTKQLQGLWKAVRTYV